jgi:polyisoprenoid-binding protein YceI
MSATTWTLSDRDGDLRLHTGVTGRVSGAGHRLTIGLLSWEVVVTWDRDTPATVEASATLSSLQVLGGEGGLTPLSDPERKLARSNALKSLDEKKYPTVTYRSTTVESVPGGYRLEGTLSLHGQEHPHPVDVVATEGESETTYSFVTAVRQTDYGIKPFSLMMGTVNVADEVRVTMEATRAH